MEFMAEVTVTESPAPPSQNNLVLWIAIGIAVMLIAIFSIIHISKKKKPTDI